MTCAGEGHQHGLEVGAGKLAIWRFGEGIKRVRSCNARNGGNAVIIQNLVRVYLHQLNLLT